MEFVQRVQELQRKFPDRVVAAILGVDETQVDTYANDPANAPPAPVTVRKAEVTIEGPSSALDGSYVLEHGLDTLAPIVMMFHSTFGGWMPALGAVANPNEVPVSEIVTIGEGESVVFTVIG